MNKILEKIKSFFDRLRKNKKTLLIENTENKEAKDKDTKKEFVESISLEKHQDILDLQNRYEQGNVQDEDLSLLQVLELTELYEKQINDLNTEIEIQKKKLDMA